MFCLRRSFQSVVPWAKSRCVSTQITNVSCSQAVGKGREVALKLGSSSSFSAASPTLQNSKRRVDGLTILLSTLLAVPFGASLYFFFTEEGKSKLQNSDFAPARFLYENVVRKMHDSIADKLLPDLLPEQEGTKTLVIDFEDTLMTLSWDQEFGWRGVKRPHVDQFLVRVASAGYEVVLFSSGVAAFLEPMTMLIDPRGAIQYRLYREATVFVDNRHVKDLSKLNRDLKDVIAIDDDPRSVEFQPENCLVVKPFTVKEDLADTTLLELALMLEDMQTRHISDVREELARYRAKGLGDALAGFRREREERIERAEIQKHSGLGGVMRGIRPPPSALHPQIKRD